MRITKFITTGFGKMHCKTGGRNVELVGVAFHQKTEFVKLSELLISFMKFQ